MRLLMALLFSVVSSWSLATVDQYAFNNAEEQAQYMALIAQLRCPKCQNQNLADSDADIAKDLRDEVYRLMQLGKTDEQIVAHLVDRYGYFVRYKPPLNQQTMFLWLSPAVLLLFAVVTVVVLLRKQRSVNATATDTQLTEAEQAQLHKLNEE